MVVESGTDESGDSHLFRTRRDQDCSGSEGDKGNPRGTKETREGEKRDQDE